MKTDGNLWILVVIELLIFAVVVLIKWLFKVYEAHKLKKALNYLTENIERKENLGREISEYNKLDKNESDAQKGEKYYE